MVDNSFVNEFLVFGNERDLGAAKMEASSKSQFTPPNQFLLEKASCIPLAHEQILGITIFHSKFSSEMNLS